MPGARTTEMHKTDLAMSEFVFYCQRQGTLVTACAEPHRECKGSRADAGNKAFKGRGPWRSQGGLWGGGED